MGINLVRCRRGLSWPKLFSLYFHSIESILWIYHGNARKLSVRRALLVVLLEGRRTEERNQ